VVALLSPREPAFRHEGKGKELVRRQGEQAAVARMGRLQAEGLSPRQIAAMLDEEGIAPKR
jgi:hypothetical protein